METKFQGQHKIPEAYCSKECENKSKVYDQGKNLWMYKYSVYVFFNQKDAVCREKMCIKFITKQLNTLNFQIGSLFSFLFGLYII